ncbi:MAG: ATP-binding cassette domain-containing protein, partial [Dehalococcoidales bacterium]|nr:ATP-binding cassette domain-containing protein [Dehalococcoidales bacterium]
MEELIRIHNLSYKYPDGQQALTDINLTIYKGDSVALVGPNGAGKSTLILHFNGIIRSDGNVRFMGKPIDDKNLKWVRSKVGLVFQNPDDQLF